MTTEFITTTIDERRVATVTLNNPDKHNAFDDNMIAELITAFQKIEMDYSIRALVLASSGKSFSAGADLDWMRRMADYSYDENLRDAGALAEMLQLLNFMPKPTIARVQGAAFGGAVGLISCCDMAVASEQARFCMSEARIGLIPATISPYVVAAIGGRAARRYFTTAEPFDANRAQILGLVSEVVESNQLDQAVNTLLDNLLANSPAAVTTAKHLVFDVVDRDINQTLISDTVQRIAAVRASAEGREGLNAFLEKRKPNWTM